MQGWKSQQQSLGRPLEGRRAARGPATWTLPCSSSSIPGPSRRPAQARNTAGDAEGLATGVLVELFAGSGLYGDGKSCCALGTARQACCPAGRSPLVSCPAEKSLDCSSSASPPRLPRPLLQEYGSILFSSLLPTLTTWRLNCRLPAILPSQVKVTHKKIQSIPAARMLAHLLASWTTGGDPPLF